MPQELLAVVPFDNGVAQKAESYRPPRGGLDRRLHNLLGEWPLPGDGRFGCYLIPNASLYSDIARVVECAVFEEFFGNTADVMAEAYGAYEESSLFLLVVDRHERRAAGALRIISHSDVGLKTLHDVEQEPLRIPTSQVRKVHQIDDLASCWDIGTLAVLKEYRGAATDHLVSMTLYGLLLSEARRRGIEHVVTVLDRHAYTQLTGLMGLPFVTIAGSSPFSYLGSHDSRACYGYVPDAVPTMEAHLNGLAPEAYKVLRPYLGRLLYCEGLPELVEVHEFVRTSTVRIGSLAR